MTSPPDCRDRTSQPAGPPTATGRAGHPQEGGCGGLVVRRGHRADRLVVPASVPRPIVPPRRLARRHPVVVFRRSVRAPQRPPEHRSPRDLPGAARRVRHGDLHALPPAGESAACCVSASPCSCSRRSRVGAPVALVVAVSVLWLPTTNLTPFLANFHFALVCAVVCAAAMPSVDRRSDVVMGLALAVALANSGVGVAVAAACAAHAVMFRPRPSRWVAVAVPSLLWVLWWRTLGNRPRAPTALRSSSALGDVADGVFGSFGALTGGWWVGGAVLLAGWVILLVHRVRTDRASALTQLAWTAGLRGLVGRPRVVATGSGRLVQHGPLRVRGCRPDPPVRAAGAAASSGSRRPRARWRMAAPALLIVGAIVLVNHDELRDAAQGRVAVRGQGRDGAVRAGGGGRAGRANTPAAAGAGSESPCRDYREKVVAPLRIADRSERGTRRGVDRTLCAARADRGPGAGGRPGVRGRPRGPPHRSRGGTPHGRSAGDGPGPPVRVVDAGCPARPCRDPPSCASLARRSSRIVPWVIEAPGACIHED